MIITGEYIYNNIKLNETHNIVENNLKKINKDMVLISVNL